MGSVKRIKGVSIVRPIMYGNISVPLKPRDRTRDTPVDHSHKWTVFVRDPSGRRDLSYVIKKVQFKLHDTYANSTRTVDKPPFEVTETGWGEFDVLIRIFFVPAASEKNLAFYHTIKLHPYGPNAKDLHIPQTVESVLYDELVFCEPTEQMLEILVSTPGAQLPAKPNRPQLPFSYQTEVDELARLKAANDKVQAEIKRSRLAIEQQEKELARLRSSQKV